MAIDLPWKREKLSEVWNWPCIFWINGFGLWAEYASTPLKRRILKWVRVVAMSYLITGYSLLVHGTMHKLTIGFEVDDIYKFFNLTITGIATFKAIQLVRYRRLLKGVMDLLDEMTGDTREPQDVATVRASMRIMWIVYVVDIALPLWVLIDWCSRPLILVFFHGQKTQTMDIWPYYVIETWSQFVFTFITQAICFTLFACGFYLYDSIFFSLAEYILCHITILKNHLEGLHLKGDVEDEIMLKKIIKRHNNLLEICKDLNEATRSVFLVLLLATVAVICVGLFIITKVKVNFVLVQNIIEVVSIVTGLSFLYCWYSNEITIQCGNIRKWAYLSRWVGGSETQKGTLLILMTKATQPVTLGGFLEINLNSFINIMKTAFSYYNFLSAVVDTEN